MKNIFKTKIKFKVLVSFINIINFRKTKAEIFFLNFLFVLKFLINFRKLKAGK